MVPMQKSLVFPDAQYIHPRKEGAETNRANIAWSRAESGNKPSSLISLFEVPSVASSGQGVLFF